MACDLCGKRGFDLVELLQVHQTPQVQHVCDACRKDLDAEKRRLQEAASKMVVDHLRSFIESRTVANAESVPPSPTAARSRLSRWMQVFGFTTAAH